MVVELIQVVSNKVTNNLTNQGEVVMRMKQMDKEKPRYNYKGKVISRKLRKQKMLVSNLASKVERMVHQIQAK